MSKLKQHLITEEKFDPEKMLKVLQKNAKKYGGQKISLELEDDKAYYVLDGMKDDIVASTYSNLMLALIGINTSGKNYGWYSGGKDGKRHLVKYM